MIVVRNLTESLKYKQLLYENHQTELLTATVSHDMRTPLNSMITIISRLKRYITEPRGLEMCDVFESSSKMLEFLVKDMLDTFQIKNGQFKKNERATDLREELQTVIEIMKIPCQKQKVDLQLEILKGTPSQLIVDIQRVKQVFMNLLQNAIKFTHQGTIKASIEYD